MEDKNEQTPPEGFDLEAEAKGAGGIVAREHIAETDHPDADPSEGQAIDDDHVDAPDLSHDEAEEV